MKKHNKNYENFEQKNIDRQYLEPHKFESIFYGTLKMQFKYNNMIFIILIILYNFNNFKSKVFVLFDNLGFEYLKVWY